MRKIYLFIGIIFCISVAVKFFGTEAGLLFSPDKIALRTYTSFYIPVINVKLFKILGDEVHNELIYYWREQGYINPHTSAQKWEVVTAHTALNFNYTGPAHQFWNKLNVDIDHVLDNAERMGFEKELWPMVIDLLNREEYWKARFLIFSSVGEYYNNDAPQIIDPEIQNFIKKHNILLKAASNKPPN
jgi:hypothetical protein